MRLPNDTHRLAVIGRTGSGKTQAGAWHLAQKDFSKKRWIIFDYKFDSLLNEIDGTQEIRVGEIPKRPGLYIVHPAAERDTEAVEEMLWKIWTEENLGVYIDEGYMIGNRSPGMNALLTQGRSKRIPMIVLSQRPVWMSRYVFSEADFFQVFRLTNIDDGKTVRGYVRSYEPDIRLPEYHSVYHDVSKEETVVLTPVPERDDILDLYYEKLGKRRVIL